MKIISLSSTVGALILSAACAAPPKKNVGQVEVATGTSVLAEQSLAQVTFRCPIEVSNGTAGPAELAKVDWELSGEAGLVTTRGSLAKTLSIPSGSTQSTDLVAAAPIDGSEEAFAARSGLTSATWRLVATVQIGTTAGTEEFEAECSGDYFPSKKPIVDVVTQVARTESLAEIHFILRVDNPNAFHLRLDRLGYVARVEAEEVAAGETGGGSMLDPNAVVEFDVTKILGQGDHQALAKKLARQKTLRYDVDFTVAVPEYSGKGTVTGTAEFAR